MAEQGNRNVFTGPDAPAAFLNPDNKIPTPLIELPPHLNPFVSDRVRIFAKAEFLSPLFNIKRLAAYTLLRRAQEAGELEGVHTLVENSSGNMAVSLAALAPYFGISRVVVIVPRDIPPVKLELLRLFGLDIEFSDTTPGAPSGVARARELGKQKGWHNLGQYGSEANPYAYEKYLAPEIWEQMDGSLTVFSAGLGTTGTVVGSARFFKKKSPRVAIIGVVPQQDSVPGVRSARRLKEVNFSWQGVLDHYKEVGTKDAFAQSLALCRAGIFAGPSSGMALAGLLQILEEKKNTGTLGTVRNDAGEVAAVFVCPDSAILYLEKYSTHLDPEDFSRVK